jgi:CheY-like chemotaxis protein
MFEDAMIRFPEAPHMARPTPDAERIRGEASNDMGCAAHEHDRDTFSVPPAAASGTSSAASTGTRRILVVEDHSDGRDLLRLMLELQGHEVVDASDGPSGFDAAQRMTPDVALIDLGLPGFDGYEVARRLRKTDWGRHMLLVAISGYGQPEDRDRTRDAGFDAHLTKPFDPVQLDTILRGTS